MAVLVTGCAGFIGSALALRLRAEGEDVIGIDDFSRKGSDLNRQSLLGYGVEVVELDLANRSSVFDVFRTRGNDISSVVHLAGQVAVTTSLADPVRDFESNAVGSFNIAEATRMFCPGAHVIYSSTNKVFGARNFSSPVGLDISAEPKTPYGVSKFIGELYFKEYRESGELTATVFRQSCIYGPGQFGVEDQGWLAWFTFANLTDAPITIYGDGSQVRDLLFVQDLIDLFIADMKIRASQTFVVGGGIGNAVSIGKAVEAIPEATGLAFYSVSLDGARVGDQRYFVSANEGLQETFGWQPKTQFHQGLAELIEWQVKNLDQISGVL